MVVGNRIFPAFGLTSVALLVITNKKLQDQITGGHGCKMGFSLEGFLKKKRKIIITQWVDQLKTQVSPHKEDARGVGGSDLIKWCREHLASYKVPAYIEFRDMLPKSKVGKLLRREIRDEERRRVSKDKS